VRGSIASKLIGHEPSWRLALLPEKPAKEAGRGFRIPSFLEQDIEYLAILINGTVQIVLLPVDPDKDFINEPPIATGT